MTEAVAAEVCVEYDVEASMRDGVVLRSTVYRPTGSGPFPVLLNRTPYGRDLGTDPAYFDPLRAARHGYVVIRQDVRGRFTSDGDFEPNHQENADGYDAVQWAASLPYCDGTVGMWGRSYHAETQWRAALERPPALRSIVPGVSAAHSWTNGGQIRGGVHEVGTRYGWVHTNILPDLLLRRHRGDPAALRRVMDRYATDLAAASTGGLLDTLPLTALTDPGSPAAPLMEWLGKPVTDPEWQRLNLDGRYGELRVPVFHIGGWYDIFLYNTLGQYQATAEIGSQPPPHLLIGPWTHLTVAGATGDLDFGPTAAGAWIDLTGQHLRWYDAILKGRTERLPADPVRLFVMGENRWRGYPRYPVPGCRTEQWYLQANGGLDRRAPAASEPDAFRYDPKDPVPTVGGATLLAPSHPSGPYDQRAIEVRPDVLSYTSEPLPQPYTVLGPVSVTLYAASSAPDTDFVSRLVDVYPDGRAIGIADGIIRASARDSYPSPGVVRPVPPSRIQPDRAYEYRIDLWATGLTFLPGHRIRVDVTSSSHPRWERNLNTGRRAYDSADTTVARQLIFHDPDRPTHIALTIVD
jgi:putative CocE/NonD family hydrolase